MLKNKRTVLFLNVCLKPVLLILNAIKAAPFNCTREVGIPLVTDASNKRLATIIAIMVAYTGLTLTMSLPVVFVTLYPSIELPMAKQGATSRIDRIITGRKFSKAAGPSSFAVSEAMGAAALATLFAPMEKATYSEEMISRARTR
jgi:hypothetical protein